MLPDALEVVKEGNHEGGEPKISTTQPRGEKCRGQRAEKQREPGIRFFCGIPAPFFIIERFERSGHGADPDFERKIQTASSSRWRLA